MPPCTELLAGWVNTYTQFRPKEKSPCEIHSPFTHLLSPASPVFLTAVSRPTFKCPPPSFPLFIPLSITLLLTSSSLNWRRGRRRGTFSFVFDFSDSHEIGYNPLMSRSEGVTPPHTHTHKKQRSLCCVHTEPSTSQCPCVRVQQGDPSGCRLSEVWNVRS